MNITFIDIFDYMSTLINITLMHSTFIFNTSLLTTILQRLQLNTTSITATQKWQDCIISTYAFHFDMQTSTVTTQHDFTNCNSRMTALHNLNLCISLQHTNLLLILTKEVHMLPHMQQTNQRTTKHCTIYKLWNK